MSRIINVDSLGKQRAQLTKAIVAALRELAQQTERGDKARDLAAFIALALESISSGIDPSVSAWEKRGYWVKADRFRMEWSWTATASRKMRAAVLASDWDAIALTCMQIAQKLSTIRVAAHHRHGQPWQDAFKRLQAG